MQRRIVSLILVLSAPVKAHAWEMAPSIGVELGSTLVGLLLLVLVLVTLRRRTGKSVKAAPERSEPSLVLEKEEVKIGIDPQSLNYPVFAYDRQGAVVLWNRAAEKLFGYRADEILGEPANRLTPPWCSAEIESHLERVQTGEVGEGFDTQRLTKNGRLVDVHLQITPYPGKTANSEGVLCSMFDTTSAHLEQQTMELHGQALESHPDALVITDAADDHRVVYANSVVSQVTGYEPEELIGRNLRLLQGEERQQLGFDRLRTALKKGESCQLVLHNYRKDGTPFWNELSVTPIRNPAGRLVNYLGIIRDVTERRENIGSMKKNITRWRKLFDLAPIGTIVCDEQGRIDAVNREICRMLGKKAEQLLGRAFEELKINPGLNQSPNTHRDEVVLERDGRPPITAKIDRIKYELKGEEEKDVYYIKDITDKRRKEQSLHREQERIHSALASMGDAVITINTRGVVDYINPSAETITGWRNDEAQGHPVMRVFNVIHEHSREPIADPVRRCLSLGRRIRLPLGTLLVGKSGRELAIQASAAPIYGSNQQVLGAVLVMQDISETHQRVKEANEQASHDPLTGLVNRRELEHQLQELLDSVREERKQHSLCMLDLDNFKPVNDLCGHGAGDEVLRQIARLLQEQLRGSDTVARIGGDEFALLLRGCSPRKAFEITTAACQAIGRYRYHWHGRVFNFGASMGLVNLDQAGLSVEQALKAADSACYEAKAQGRGRVVLYDENMEARPAHEPEAGWVQKIALAIENGGMELLVQSVTSLSNRLSESLWRITLRYRGKNGSITEPNVFLPVLERYRSLPDLDRWLITETLVSLEKQLSEQGVYILGLSGQSLEDPGFSDFLLNMLNRSAVDPGSLCFEVSEYDLARLPGTGGALLEQLRHKGCRICLSEFTSGLNLASNLRGELFDYIRWSSGISSALEEGPLGEAVVRGLNQVSHAAGACTIATGVNDDVSLARLRKMHVDFAEGEAVGRPFQLNNGVYEKSQASD